MDAARGGWWELRVPDPQFPTKTATGRQSSRPVPSSTARIATSGQQGRLPARSPGSHMHPLLRRRALASCYGERRVS